MKENAYRGNTKPIYKGKDYTGLFLGNWKILGEIKCVRTSNKNYHTRWKCQCSCGSEPQWILKENLIKGLSSGCSNCYSKRHSGSNNPNWKGYGKIPSSLITHIKHGAKSRNLEYSLSPRYLNSLWQRTGGVCALSGIKISINETASLDRIDSSKGYIPGNVQWIHKKVNIMKRDISQKDFIEICKAVSVNHVD